MENKPRAFTISYNHLSNEIRSCVSIGTPCRPGTKAPFLAKNCQALWDTGATHTVINKTLVASCGLQPTGRVAVAGVQGGFSASTYLVSITLPNRIRFPAIRVTEGDLGDIDILVGMDIISTGDFCITNHRQKTRMSFRVPSLFDADFRK